jgi:hypothetical protein
MQRASFIEVKQTQSQGSIDVNLATALGGVWAGIPSTRGTAVSFTSSFSSLIQENQNRVPISFPIDCNNCYMPVQVGCNRSEHS